MNENVTIDLISHDPSHDEYVLYLVEDGPWSDDPTEFAIELQRIQHRLFQTLDAAIDGHLAEKYPESAGMAVRIQVDSPSGLPDELCELVTKLNALIHQMDNDYGQALVDSTFVPKLRIVTGHEMGRFGVTDDS